MRKPFIIILFIQACCLSPVLIIAQTTDSSATWSVSAYADVYYARYSDDVGVGNFQKIPTVSPRSYSFGLNAFQLSSQYDGNNIRANAILHFGDIPASAWSSKYNVIQEAHVGVKLLKTLWIDAGFFKTHFGTEYLMPKDNIASSVTMLTYYEPYYESGVRLNFDPINKLEINLFALNGYGIFEDNNKKKSFGLGITYLLGDKGNIGYTNYIGDDSPRGDSLPHTRFANNIFLNYTFFNKLTIQIGGDLYFQQNSDIETGTKNAMAYGAMATEKYQFHPKFAVYDRLELFWDPQGFLSTIYANNSGIQRGYESYGGTIGVEYKPSSKSYIRVEYRRLQMANHENIFYTDHQNVDYRNDLMVNMGVYFDLLKGSDNKK